MFSQMFLFSNVVNCFFHCHYLDLVPGMIKNVVTEGAFDSISVTWTGEPEDKNGDILYFTVYWSEDGQVPESDNVTDGDETYTIRGLKPITEYIIQVSATTSVGEGPKSNETAESTRTGREYEELTPLFWGLLDMFG